MHKKSILLTRTKRNGSTEQLVNWKLIKILIDPIRWTPVWKDDKPEKQYYHLHTREAMTLKEVFQYLEIRCEFSGVFFPEWPHPKYTGLTRGIKSLILRQDLPEGVKLFSEPVKPRQLITLKKPNQIDH